MRLSIEIGLLLESLSSDLLVLNVLDTKYHGWTFLISEAILSQYGSMAFGVQAERQRQRSEYLFYS